MNLTILSLQLTAISIIPTFTQIKHLDLKFSTFSHFASPLIFNSYGHFSQNKFSHALSSVVVTEKAEIIDFTCANPNEKEQMWNDTVFDSIISNDKAVISLDSCDSVTIGHVSFHSCNSQVETGLISVTNTDNFIISNGCFAACYTKGANCIYTESQKSDISLITSIQCTSYYAESSITTFNSTFDADYINVTNCNLLMSATFSCFESTGIVNFLICQTTFDVNAIMIHQCNSIEFDFCQIIESIFNENILKISSSFAFNHSICVGYKCNEFIGFIADEIGNGDPGEIEYWFSVCAFDQPMSSISEQSTRFIQCTFSLQYTYTITASFLNTRYCAGFRLSTYEESSPSSNLELTGMVVILVGIVLVIIYIIRAILILKGFIQKEEQKEEESEESMSISLSENSGFRFRIRRSTFDEGDVEELPLEDTAPPTSPLMKRAANAPIIRRKQGSDISQDSSSYSHHSSSEVSSMSSISDTIPKKSKLQKSPKYQKNSDSSSSLSLSNYISRKRSSRHRYDDSSSSVSSDLSLPKLRRAKK